MNARTPLVVAVVGVCLASTLTYLLMGDWTSQPLVKVVQQVGVVATVVGVIVGVLALITGRLADYREPATDEEFEKVVARSEYLAAQGLAVEPDEDEFLAKDPYDDTDFAELVRDALDDLPDLLIGVLQGNVAVVISDDGRKHHAYGLYMGDGATRDDHSDRIMIFRDTLRRDFGHDADLLREQVTITVRHELAHHVGFDELGVRDLGL
ncbi:metallopeptidase family protein [Patulibacter minatonensis]|uniref:metallopeptidase family protein n=1 Tax=Patulibacter minatonensis TaxID=298163 RepID=UPI000685F27B|nr:metallopeptidase family protein [Patulibacter minatonensis]